jgi:hypothetical protein
MRHFEESLTEGPIAYEFRRRHSLHRPQLRPRQPIEPNCYKRLRARHSTRKASDWLDEPHRSKVTASFILKKVIRVRYNQGVGETSHANPNRLNQ